MIGHAASISSLTPSPVTAEISKNFSFSFFARFSSAVTRFGSSSASILLAATSCGFASISGLYSSSSRRIVSKSSTGSRPDSLEMSTR